MHRPERTIVCGTSASPPRLDLIDEMERLMTFAVSAECVGRPPAVPSKNNSQNVSGFPSCPRLSK